MGQKLYSAKNRNCSNSQPNGRSNYLGLFRGIDTPSPGRGRPGLHWLRRSIFKETRLHTPSYPPSCARPDSRGRLSLHNLAWLEVCGLRSEVREQTLITSSCPDLLPTDRPSR
jgi:hypothetical protein